MSKGEVIIAIIQTIALLLFSCTAFLVMRSAFRRQDEWVEKMKRERE